MSKRLSNEDKKWNEIMNLELGFIHTHIQDFFRATADLAHSNDLVAQHTEWKYSTHFCNNSALNRQWGGVRYRKLFPCLYGPKNHT